MRLLETEALDVKKPFQGFSGPERLLFARRNY